MAGNDIAVRITADSTQFQREMAKATTAAGGAAAGVRKAFSGVQGALAGLGLTFSAVAFVGLIKGSIDAADKLNDLSQTTGVAATTLGGIGFAAKQAGSDLDTVAKAFGKFNLEIAKATGGDKDAINTFKLLGLSVKELESAKPDEILARVADQFEKFADGPNKAAIANELFKKGYQDLIPLLNEGGDALRQNIAYFERYSGITDELTKSADQFNDTVDKAKLLNGAFANTLAAKLLPSLQGLVEMFVESKEKGDGFAESTDRIVAGLQVIAKAAVWTVSKFVNLGDLLGSLAAQAGALARLDFKAVGAIADAREESRKKFAADLNTVFDAIEGKNPKAGLAKPKKKPQAPSLGTSAADVKDTAKAFLEAQLKGYENVIKDEEDLLKDRENFLRMYYEQDQISIKEYFDRRNEVIASAVAKELAAYDGEIRALQDFAAKATPKDRIDAEAKILDVIAKRSKVEQDAAKKGVDAWFEQNKAAAQFSAQLEDISAKLRQMSGDTVGADMFGFDRSTQDFKARAEVQAASLDQAEAAGGRFALSQLAALRNLTEQQSRLNKSQRDYGNTMIDIGTKQGQINLLQSSGQITTLEAMNKRAELAQSYIALLEREASAQEAIANAMPEGEAKNDVVRNIQQLRLEIDTLAESAYELEDIFRKTFEDALSNSLVDVISGTKSLSAAFKDMEKQIVASISRIASQNIAEAIFGQSGPAGGASGFLASLFGGASRGGGGGIGSFLSSLFGGGSDLAFAFASGGSPPVGRASLVGERGPELFVPKEQGVIVPNDVLTARRSAKSQTNNVSINITVPGNVSRETADQIAMKSGAAVQRAMARNG